MTTDPVGHASQKRRRPLYKDLSVQILVAMLLGVLVGYLWPESADAMKPLGDLFIKLVRMLVAPIIFCTVVHGIASVSDARRVGRVAIKALIYFEIVTTIALVLGLVAREYVGPGRRHERRSGHPGRQQCVQLRRGWPDRSASASSFSISCRQARLAPSPTATSSLFCSSRCCSRSRCWPWARRDGPRSTPSTLCRRCCSR